ncbi:hypothetical protein J6590_050400 [Homalodisca vitripennis]|nr:hypothetical protein J6590_050400 [Homalodisca vitripennis]
MCGGPVTYLLGGDRSWQRPRQSLVSLVKVKLIAEVTVISEWRRRRGGKLSPEETVE